MFLKSITNNKVLFGLSVINTLFAVNNLIQLTSPTATPLEAVFTVFVWIITLAGWAVLGVDALVLTTIQEERKQNESQSSS